MEKIGVTAGRTYFDLDGLACVIAYTELLKLEGKDAESFIPGKLNSSVTEKIRGWEVEYKKAPKNSDEYTYVIMDVSEPNDIADFVEIEKVIEIYDHHSGYEDFWKEKIGDRAKIEKIGAAATLIWEEFKRREKQKEISQTSARLLYGAIASNTLNFKASVTDKRDILAFKELSRIVDLPEDWVEKYFRDQEKYVYENPKESIENDVKTLTFGNLEKEIVIGQMELWNTKDFVIDNKQLIEKIMESFGNKNWFFTAPSISKGKNHLLAKSPEIIRLLTKHFGAEFSGNTGKIDKLFLRKEFVAKLLNL